MRKYDVIPLPQLRRMYRSRREARRILMELSMDLAFVAIYGLTIGLMMMGLWFEF